MLSLMRLTFVPLNVVCKNWNFSEKYQADFINFLVFYVVVFPTHSPALLYPRHSSMEEKWRNTNVLVASKLFDRLIFITTSIVED